MFSGVADNNKTMKRLIDDFDELCFFRLVQCFMIVYVYLNTQCNHKKVVKFDRQKASVVVAVS